MDEEQCSLPGLLPGGASTAALHIQLNITAVARSVEHFPQVLQNHVDA